MILKWNLAELTCEKRWVESEYERNPHAWFLTTARQGIEPWYDTNYIIRACGDALLRPLTWQNWSRNRKWTQSCWCLHWFSGSRADVWKMLLQVYTWPVVTQVWIEKMFNKNIEIGFQSAVLHLCQRVLVPLLHNDRGLNATTSN